MTPRLQSVGRRLDALSLRERLLVLVAALVVLVGLWEAVLAAPLAARKAAAAAEIEAVTARIDQLTESLALAAAGMTENMPERLERLRALEARIAAAQEEVKVYTSDLVDPSQMRFVLADLVERQPGLELVRIANLESRPLLEEEAPSEPPGTDHSPADTPQLYWHGVVLELRGGYLDGLEYLEAVERLPWKLYWTRLDLNAAKHPVELVIEIQTLSLDKEWIGV